MPDLPDPLSILSQVWRGLEGAGVPAGGLPTVPPVGPASYPSPGGKAPAVSEDAAEPPSPDTSAAPPASAPDSPLARMAALNESIRAHMYAHRHDVSYQVLERITAREQAIVQGIARHQAAVAGAAAPPEPAPEPEPEPEPEEG